MPDLQGALPRAEGAKTELYSWKEIATYLDVSVKTAQKYESDMGMPVRRIGTRVTISVAELESWKNSAATPGSWRTNVRLLQTVAASSLLLFACTALAALAFWFHQRPGLPASATGEGSLLHVKDAAGRTVWTHLFPSTLMLTREYDHLAHRIVDLDGDGAPEALGVWYHSGRDSQGWGVQCFSPKGQLLWDLQLADTVRSVRGQSFGPPFVVRDFEVFDSPEKDGTKWIAVLFVHVADVPSTLLIVDHTGKRRGQYWHVGHLNSLAMFDADADGTAELVAGGVRHGAEQAVLVAFHPARVGGVNPMPAGHPRSLAGLPPSTEKVTAFFARSELSKETKMFNYVSNLYLSQGRLQVHLYEQLQSPDAYLVYELKPGLEPLLPSMPVAFAAAHQAHILRDKFDKNFPDNELHRLRREFRKEIHPLP